jgi:splicing factor 3A subunit 1
VDRTASVVAQKGEKFEAFIRKKEAANPKFQFLADDNAYHAFYRKRIAEFKQGEAQVFDPSKANVVSTDSIPVSEPVTGVPPADAVDTAVPSSVSPVSSADQASVIAASSASVSARQSAAIVKEEAKRVKPPCDIFSVQLPPTLSVRELEKIKLVAMYAAGHKQLDKYATRFTFCNSKHPVYHVYEAFFKAYQQVVADIQCFSTTGRFCNPLPAERSSLLEQLRYRAEFESVEEEEREAEKEAQKNAQVEDDPFAIDWQDFVVVETLTEEGIFPSAKQRSSVPEGATLGLPVVGEFEGLKVVRGDIPEIAARPKTADDPLVVDPVTGSLIPMSKLSEHLRISLMSAQWKEQKQKEADKLSTSNLASDTDALNALSRFRNALENPEAEQERLIAENKGKVIWDGYSSSRNLLAQKAAQRAAVVGQTDTLRKRAASEMEQPLIGPHPVKVPRLDAGPPPPPPHPMPGLLPPGTVMPPAPTVSSVPGATEHTAAPLLARPLSSSAVFPPPGRPNHVPLPAKPLSMPLPMPMPMPVPHSIVGDSRAVPTPSVVSSASQSAQLLVPPAVVPAFSAAVPGGLLLPAYADDEQNSDNEGVEDIPIHIQCPEADQSSWNLHGQLLDVVISNGSTVSELKQVILQSLASDLAPGKLKLSSASGMFFKDGDQLSRIGIKRDDTLTLSLKERGGRKK